MWSAIVVTADAIAGGQDVSPMHQAIHADRQIRRGACTDVLLPTPNVDMGDRQVIPGTLVITLGTEDARHAPTLKKKSP